MTAATLEADAAEFRCEPDIVLKGGWYTLWIMLALTLFGFVDRQVLTLAAAPMSESISLTDSELGMVQGLAFAIFTVIAVYPLAWAADRFDRRIVLGACVTVWSIGTAACGLAQNFTQLFCAAILIAAGEAGLVPIATSFVPELFKGRKRLLANGLIYVFSYLGVAAGLALGGSAIGWLDAHHGSLPPALQSYESWRLAFFLVALPAPLFLVLLAFTRLGHREIEKQESALQAADHTADAAAFLPYAKKHWRALVPVFAGLCFYVVAFNSFLVWLPITTTRLFGTTPGENGMGMGLATALGMLGGVSAGTYAVRRLITRMGPAATIRTFWVAMLISAPILFLFPFISAAWHAFTLFGLLMLSGTAVGSMVPTMLQDMAPIELRARIFALSGIASGLFGGLAPTLVGWTSSALGTAPHLLLTAMTLVSVPCWVLAIIIFRIAEHPFAEHAHGITGTGIAS
ncbi:MAG: MFS transporter [Chakrabartia sp.]